MTDHHAVWTDQVPDACTLPTAEQPLRLAEFDALFTAAARDAERFGPQHLRVTLHGGADVADSVRDLAARESQCCSFFTLTVTAPQEGMVHLDIEVPAAHIDVLDTLQRRATAARSQT
ncbi:MAG TPA: hypothetical protein VFC19_27400 [Candidatus Limnocylindrales bacterium]|nr:hypothetical protein [Candidatus Limnocylindrales bacterium]